LDTLPYVAVVIAIAYVVRGIAGFGSALIAVPLLALTQPITVVVPLVVLLDYLCSATQGIKNRQHIQWQELLPLLPFTFTGVISALYLFRHLDAASLAQALGIFIVIYAVYQLLPLKHLNGSRLLAAPAGVLGGMVGTLFGTGGPFYVIYFTLRNLDKGAFRATFATNFLIDGSIRLVGYATAGFFLGDTLDLLAIAIPTALLGLYLGGQIHTNLPQVLFTRLVSVLLLGSGTALLVK
jgi:uncharacterized membrane protein YfcA